MNIDSYNVSAYVGEGNAYNTAGDYYRAVDKFNQALKLDLHNVSAKKGRKIAYRNLQETSKYVFGSAEKAFESGDYSKAIDGYTKAIKYSSGQAHYYTRRGDTYFILDNFFF